jgi:hypothetical protein
MMSVLRLFMRHFAIAAVLLVFALGAFVGGMAVQSPAAGSAATTAKSQALIDLTGYWVSMVNEDWRWRMMTPAKGDYASVGRTTTLYGWTSMLGCRRASSTSTAPDGKGE